MEIVITEKALDMLKNKLGTEEFLRITITEGGCAGLTYGAEIDNVIRDGENIVLQQDDIRVVSNDESAQYLDGLIIDFSDDLIAGGLRFTNKNARSTCGCGASFNLSGFPVAEDGKCGI